MTPWDNDQLIAAFDEEFTSLISFARASRVACGFGSLDARGIVDPARPVELWITARMTYVLPSPHCVETPAPAKKSTTASQHSHTTSVTVSTADGTRDSSLPIPTTQQTAGKFAPPSTTVSKKPMPTPS